MARKTEKIKTNFSFRKFKNKINISIQSIDFFKKKKSNNFFFFFQCLHLYIEVNMFMSEHNLILKIY